MFAIDFYVFETGTSGFPTKSTPAFLPRFSTNPDDALANFPKNSVPRRGQLSEPIRAWHRWGIGRWDIDHTVDGKLVGGWTNPFEKYERQNGWKSSPSFGVNIKSVWNHHPEDDGRNPARKPVEVDSWNPQYL